MKASRSEYEEDYCLACAYMKKVEETGSTKPLAPTLERKILAEQSTRSIPVISGTGADLFNNANRFF